jgi:hypothetical protein
VVLEDPADENGRLGDGGGVGMVRSESSSPSVPRTEEKRATNGRTYKRHAE